MISLNTYSFGYSMGLLKSSPTKSWKLKNFIRFCKTKKINSLEFPLDYFLKKEKISAEKLFLELKKKNIYPIIDLENINLGMIKKLSLLNKEFTFDLIRIKMSNHFGGNRHEVKDFKKIKHKFILDIKRILKIIKKTDLKIAIENHQDLTSNEIIKIVKNTSVEKVGVNWDIGNSLATIETPEDFFENTKKYILNVHSKDYKVIKSNVGFFLKRCVIGEGIVDFKKYVNYFKKNNINLSVELGAHYSRHCKVYNPAFIYAHKIDMEHLNYFNRYLNQVAVDENPFTDWEIYKNEKNCYKDEIKDVNKSVNFIKRIYA